jgi:SAM-dependent methyltransferase
MSRIVLSKVNKTWSTPVVSEEKRFIPCALCNGLLFKPSLSCEGFSYVRCEGCGLVQMNPQAVEEKTKSRYGILHGEDYLAYELTNENSFLTLQLLALEDAGFDALERELQPKGKPDSPDLNAFARILDIGCATGSLLAWLRDRGWKTLGVEISGPQAEYGRQRRSLDIRSLSLEENRFPAGSFDVVLASHLLEHLNDPAALVMEVHRVLVPGGRFFVTTPNIAGFQARIFGSRWRSAIFDHLYLFSIKTLSRLLREKGFVIEKTVTWGGLASGTAPTPVKHLFDKAAKRLGFGDVMIMRARRD